MRNRWRRRGKGEARGKNVGRKIQHTIQHLSHRGVMPAWRHGSQQLLPVEPVRLPEAGAPARMASPDANMTATCKVWQTQGGACTHGWPSATPMWGNHRWKRSGQGRQEEGHTGQMCAHTTQLYMAQSVTYTVLREAAHGVNIYSNVSLSHCKVLGQCSLVLRLLVGLGTGLGKYDTEKNMHS